jgi:hypothetical protein
MSSRARNDTTVPIGGTVGPIAGDPPDGHCVAVACSCACGRQPRREHALAARGDLAAAEQQRPPVSTPTEPVDIRRRCVHATTNLSRHG